MLSSTIGGYLAGRLRAKWHTVHEHERYFRDSAHGFTVWALATVLTAGFLGGAVSHLIPGAAAGAASLTAAIDRPLTAMSTACCAPIRLTALKPPRHRPHLRRQKDRR